MTPYRLIATDLDGTLLRPDSSVSERSRRAIRQAQATCAITGIAGPAGGTDEKPVGTVCFAWALSGAALVSERQQFAGSRQEIRAQSVRHALRNLLALMP